MQEQASSRLTGTPAQGTPALHSLPGILWTASGHHEPTSRHNLSPDSAVASRVSVSICGVLLPSSGKAWNLWYSAGSRIHNFTWENWLHTQSHLQPEAGGSLLTCDLDPGVIGTLRLFKSQMKISESLAPEARRFPCIRINIKDISKDSPPISERRRRPTFGEHRASLIAPAWRLWENVFIQTSHTMPWPDQLKHSTWKGLKSRALTAPVCFCLWAIKGSCPEERMWVTLYRVSKPLSPPPAITPEFSWSPWPKLPQISLWNLQRKII